MEIISTDERVVQNISSAYHITLWTVSTYLPDLLPGRNQVDDAFTTVVFRQLSESVQHKFFNYLEKLSRVLLYYGGYYGCLVKDVDGKFFWYKADCVLVTDIASLVFNDCPFLKQIYEEYLSADKLADGSGPKVGCLIRDKIKEKIYLRAIFVTKD